MRGEAETTGSGKPFHVQCHVAMMTLVAMVTQHAEERVAGLEAKLSSLSESIGGYERLRENDQATTQ